MSRPSILARLLTFARWVLYFGAPTGEPTDPAMRPAPRPASRPGSHPGSRQGSRPAPRQGSHPSARQGSRPAARTASRAPNRNPVRPPDRTRATAPARPRAAGPADYDGVVHPVYEPVLDGDGDPGEVVWTWVPYEEDRTRGKDRPVLVIGRDGKWLLGLMLTSKDHTRDAADEARHGRRWLDIGSGGWDPQRRPSEIRLDRVLRIDPAAVRREGAIMNRKVFDGVANSLRTR